MRAMRTSFLIAVLLSVASAAAAQVRPRPYFAELPPLFAPVFGATGNPYPLRATTAKDFRVAIASDVEFDFVFAATSGYSKPTASPQAAANFRVVDLPGPVSLRLTADQTSFLTESRIPLAEMFSGRLRLSGVQQRFHDANLFSAVSPNWARDIALAPGTESIIGRSRVNYGLGLQFRFDP